MPKTSVYKDGDALCGKEKIWLPWHIFTMQLPAGNPKANQGHPKCNFSAFIPLPSNRTHRFGTGDLHTFEFIGPKDNF